MLIRPGERCLMGIWSRAVVFDPVARRARYYSQPALVGPRCASARKRSGGTVVAAPNSAAQLTGPSRPTGESLPGTSRSRFPRPVSGQSTSPRNGFQLSTETLEVAQISSISNTCAMNGARRHDREGVAGMAITGVFRTPAAARHHLSSGPVPAGAAGRSAPGRGGPVHEHLRATLVSSTQ